MPAIDHTAYPSIIDNIASHCQPLALQRLRGTCRQLRARADGLLFAHAVLERDESALLPDTFKLVATSDERIPWRPDLVRVLDIPYLDLAQEMHMPPVLERFTAVHTVRRSSREWFVYPTPLTIVKATAGSVGDRHPTNGQRSHVQPSTARYIFHLIGGHKPQDVNLVGYHTDRPIAEGVFVYHPVAPDPHRPPPIVSPMRRFTRWCHCNAAHAPLDALITVVGAEAHLNPLPEGLHALIDQVYGAQMASQWSRLPHASRTVTMAQWVAELTAEGREFEASGWAGRREVQREEAVGV